MENKKRCFIITPIGSDNSEIRNKADGVIKAVVKPVLDKLEIEVISPSAMSEQGSITEQVIKHIIECELVIANLTGTNPNVMYELAIRHAAQKPIVCIVEQGTKLPFDIQDDRVIFYYDTMYCVPILKDNLEKAIKSALNQDIEDINNPLVRTIKNKNLIERISKSGDPNKDAIKLMLDKLERIESNTHHIRTRTQGVFSPSEYHPEFIIKIYFCDNVIDNILDPITDTIVSFYYSKEVYIAIVYEKETNTLIIKNGNGVTGVDGLITDIERQYNLGKLIFDELPF